MLLIKKTHYWTVPRDHSFHSLDCSEKPNRKDFFVLRAPKEGEKSWPPDFIYQNISDEISSSNLWTNTPDTLNDLVSCYNSTLASDLNRRAPLITKTIPAGPLVPWLNDDIKEARRQRRRAKRRWRRTGLEADFLAYKAIKNKTTFW